MPISQRVISKQVFSPGIRGHLLKLQLTPLPHCPKALQWSLLGERISSVAIPDGRSKVARKLGTTSRMYGGDEGMRVLRKGLTYINFPNFVPAGGYHVK